MAIKITGQPVPPSMEAGVTAGPRPRGRPEANEAISRHGAGGRGEAVSLTSGASRLQALVRQVADLPEVDMERVAEVRARLQEGRLDMDPHRVAAKLLAFEQGRARL